MSEKETGSDGAKTVTVACKIPSGLVLQLCEEQDRSEAVMGGGVKNFKQFFKVGEKVTLNGFSVPRGPDFDADNVQPVAGGFGLTYGVNAEFFRKWMEQNKDSDMVRNKLIFAHEKPEYVRDKAKERQADVLSGLEPLKQAGDPRAPRGVRTAEKEAA